MLRRAPDILQYCRDKGYQHVGVLKFRVKKGDDPTSDSVGTFNTFLAERLEAALILKSKSRGVDPLMILRNASASAAKITGASHRSSGGRERLFSGRYDPAWGGSRNTATADAFVTGVVIISPDLQGMRVGILAFDKTTNQLIRIAPVFDAPVDLDTLAEIGEGYALRGAFDEGAVDMTSKQIVKQAAKVKSQSADHPLRDNQAAPVFLDVLYDGQPVRVEFQKGQARIPEPHEGQRVELRVRRNPQVPEQRLAIVLKVNGHNTLFRERKRDIDCRKWVMEKGNRQFTIRGYHKSNTEYERFRVLSKQESKRQEMNYGADVGMITLVVFRESAGRVEQTPNLLDVEDEDVLAMMRGTFPKQRPDSLAMLKQSLQEGARGKIETRGILEGGEKERGKITATKFNPEPKPVMVAAIRYYDAK